MKTYSLVSYIRQRKVTIGCMTGLRKVINGVRMLLYFLLEELSHQPHKGVGPHNGLQTKRPV